MKKSTLRLTSAAVALVITTALVAGISSANEGRLFPFNKIAPETQEAIEETLENNDYDTWKKLMGDNKMGDIITSENFAQLVKMHQLVQEGDWQGAKEIRKELNLPVRPHKVMGLAKNIIRSLADRQAIDEAIANNDYQAWVKAMNGQGEELNVINEDNFNQYVEAYNLIEAGRNQMDQGMKTMKDLGLNRGMPMIHKFPSVVAQE